jgi:hypothetical protein
MANAVANPARPHRHFLHRFLPSFIVLRTVVAHILLQLGSERNALLHRWRQVGRGPFQRRKIRPQETTPQEQAFA